jgi:iduronate 2-sulfatase
MMNRLKQASRNESYQPFFLALGVHKPHLPFYIPERFLDYYPEEEIDLPYNPYVPTDMPDAA